MRLFTLCTSLWNTDRRSESLLHKNQYKDPGPWSENESLCVCQDLNSSTGDAVCSANEEETCKQKIPHEGRTIGTKKRQKRDTYHINLDFDRRLAMMHEYLRQTTSKRIKVNFTNMFVSLASKGKGRSVGEIFFFILGCMKLNSKL